MQGGQEERARAGRRCRHSKGQADTQRSAKDGAPIYVTALIPMMWRLTDGPCSVRSHCLSIFMSGGTCTHSHLHTHKQTDTHAEKHTHSHTRTYTDSNAHAHEHSRTHTLSRTLTLIRTRTHTQTLISCTLGLLSILTPTRTHIRTSSLSRTRTRTHTHVDPYVDTHIHSQMNAIVEFILYFWNVKKSMVMF